MMEQYGATHTIPAGTVVMLSDGSYSDYQWVCLARAKRDVDIQAAARELAGVHGSPFYSNDKMIAWLVGPGGYFEELPRPCEWNVEYMRVTGQPEDADAD